MKKTFLVTGGLGFLGQYLTAALLEQYPDAAVTIAARSERPLFHPVLNRPEHRERLTVIHGTDLLNPESLRPAFGEADAVFHAAAMVSFRRKDRDLLLRQNVEGTKTVLQLCRDSGTEKLVHVSSTAALGYNDDRNHPADETLKFDWTKGQKYSYALSKYYAGQAVTEAASRGLPAVSANICSIYGPGDNKIIPLLDSVKNGKLPAMMPGGLACIDVRDAAEGLIALYERGRPGEKYILAGGNHTHRELISTIARVLGVPVPGRTFSMRTGEFLKPLISLMETLSPGTPKITSEIFDMGFKFRYYSTAKAESELSWTPHYLLEKTFLEIAEEYQKTAREGGSV